MHLIQDRVISFHFVQNKVKKGWGGGGGKFDQKAQDPVLETASYPIINPKCCTYQIWKEIPFESPGH